MRLVDVNVMRRHMACWGGRRSGSHSRSHTHTHTLRHTQTCREWTAVKDLKATGSYLTNLKVNDFSISPHPRLISVTGIGLVNSVTCMPACWWRRGLYARLHSHRGGAQSNLKCILCFFYLFIYLFFYQPHFNYSGFRNPLIPRKLCPAWKWSDPSVQRETPQYVTFISLGRD